ncbi:MAG: hypothetical protein ACRETN_02525 [Nevskiales bacterium]
MDRTVKYSLEITAALLLASTFFFVANAAPTQADVDQARAECRDHRERVKKRDGFARDEEKHAMGAACGRATALMDELAGAPPQASATEQPTGEPSAGSEPAAAPAETEPAATATPADTPAEAEPAPAGP